MIFVPYEPKVAFRFRMLIDGIPAFVIKASQMPQLEQNEIIMEHINTDFRVKGKSRWQNINITLYDPIDPSAAQAVHNWINGHHNSASGIDGFAFAEYKKDITIQALGPKQEPVEIWTLFGAYVKTSNWGQMDWSTEDAKTIELTLSYDYAILS